MAGKCYIKGQGALGLTVWGYKPINSKDVIFQSLLCQRKFILSSFSFFTQNMSLPSKIKIKKIGYDILVAEQTSISISWLYMARMIIQHPLSIICIDGTFKIQNTKLSGVIITTEYYGQDKKSYNKEIMQEQSKNKMPWYENKVIIIVIIIPE